MRDECNAKILKTVSSCRSFRRKLREKNGVGATRKGLATSISVIKTPKKDKGTFQDQMESQGKVVLERPKKDEKYIDL